MVVGGWWLALVVVMAKESLCCWWRPNSRMIIQIAVLSGDLNGIGDKIVRMGRVGASAR